MNNERLFKLLSEGRSIAEVARMLREPYSSVYRIIKKSGKIFKRNLNKFPNKTERLKRKTTLSKDKMLELYDSGVSQQEIARRGNCSRQYVHQLVQASGRKSARQKQKEKQKALKELREQKVALKRQHFEIQRELSKVATKEVLFKRWEQARLWWDQGLEAKEIAAKMNMPISSLQWYIGRYRKEFGWFKNRKVFRKEA